jgi:hypothetical protein
MQTRNPRKAVFRVFQVFQKLRRPVTAGLSAVEHLTTQGGTHGVPDARGVPPLAGLEWNTSGRIRAAPAPGQAEHDAGPVLP